MTLRARIKEVLQSIDNTEKKLVDYESIDALVAALMSHYNNELDKIDTKFKNYCGIPIGGVLSMWNNSNPAEIFTGTTWELLPDDKYLKTTTDTPLQTGGNNTISISKANLPTEKLRIDTIILTTGEHKHFGDSAYFVRNGGNATGGAGVGSKDQGGGNMNDGYSSAGNTGSASPSTENLGSGTPITINPEHITVKAWKRLT